jgi:hypothetical protein
MLEESTIDIGKITYINKSDNDIAKIAINDKIVENVRLWNDIKLKDIFTDEDDANFLVMINYLVQKAFINDDKPFDITFEEIKRDLFENGFTNYVIARMFRQIERNGLISYKMSGMKRLRSWVVSNEFYFDCLIE